MNTELLISWNPKYGLADTDSADFEGLRFRTFWNLNKREGLFSMILWSDPQKLVARGIDPKLNKKTIGYGRNFYLDNPNFVVRESGRQRTLNTQQKCVHAFINGTLLLKNPSRFDIEELAPINYRPENGSFFYLVEHNDPRNVKIYNAYLAWLGFRTGESLSLKGEPTQGIHAAPRIL